MAGGLVLGPVVFRDFEVPERIRFGGKQRLAVHSLPGGGRVVDAMGAEEGPIGWSGVFSGADAAARVRQLERLRREGEALELSWEGWRYTVVIEAFQAATSNPAWIPYRVQTCVVDTGGELGEEAGLAGMVRTQAEALGAGPGLDARIAGAEASIGSGDVGAAMEGARLLAQLVAARAFSGSI